ncbi:MAG: hypothetical protein ACOZNI_08170 [Myxococcota bacterium]
MRFFPLLALLAGCPVPEEDDEDKPDRGDETGHVGEDAYGGGRCGYTSAALAAEDEVPAIGGSASDAALVYSGARATTFAYLDGGETTLDHALTLDASTALLWTGERREDTGYWEDETDSETATAPGEETEDDPGTGVEDTAGEVGYEDTGADTGGGGEDVECPSFVTLEADWTFGTGDGAFDEAMRVTVRVESMTEATLDHALAYDDLGGDWVPEGEDPGEWDTFEVEFDATLDVGAEYGFVTMTASRTDGDFGVAMRGDVGGWPASDESEAETAP